MEQENLYKNVPGFGKRLADGTWWTNCDAYAGQFSENGAHRKFENGEYWAAPNQFKCLETAFFDGEPFARWEELPKKYRPCYRDSQGVWRYKPNI